MPTNRSGIKVQSTDVPIIMGMINRGDRHHDIAAWFGLNQGRIKDTQDGKYGPALTVANTSLPPKGPPGPKGRRLQTAAAQAVQALKNGDAAEAQNILKLAIQNYETHEA